MSCQEWRRVEIRCQCGASGHVFWGLSSFMMLMLCFSCLATPQTLQKTTLAKLRLLHHILRCEDVASQQSPFSDHISDKISCISRKRQISFANNCNDVWVFPFLQARKYLAIEHREISSLNQFYAAKSHSQTLLINLPAKNDMRFWLLLHYLLYFFWGTHLASRLWFLKISKELVPIVSQEVCLPKGPEWININLIMMMRFGLTFFFWLSGSFVVFSHCKVLLMCYVY